MKIEKVLIWDWTSKSGHFVSLSEFAIVLKPYLDALDRATESEKVPAPAPNLEDMPEDPIEWWAELFRRFPSVAKKLQKENPPIEARILGAALDTVRHETRATATPPPPEEWQVGDRVEIEILKAVPEHNGKRIATKGQLLYRNDHQAFIVTDDDEMTGAGLSRCRWLSRPSLIKGQVVRIDTGETGVVWAVEDEKQCRVLVAGHNGIANFSRDSLSPITLPLKEKP